MSNQYPPDPRAPAQYPPPAPRSPPPGGDVNGYNPPDPPRTSQYPPDHRTTATYSSDQRPPDQYPAADPRTPTSRGDRNGYNPQNPPATGQYPPDPRTAATYSSDQRPSGQNPPPDPRSPTSRDDRNGYNPQNPPTAGQYPPDSRTAATYSSDQRPLDQYPPSDARSPTSGGDRNGYNAQNPPATGQYPPDPRTAVNYPSDQRPLGQYPPPSSWHHPLPGLYPSPIPQYPDPAPPAYPYPPGPPADISQPPQPRHPDPYRLPPPYPYPSPYPPGPYPPPTVPAPRQRTAIACKYCRRRKIRCSGYESSQDGRCQNCVRFNQNCLFHPVSSQAAFVPAQAVYPNMKNVRRDPAQTNPRGEYRPPGFFSREEESPPMLYGAHGIPLAPAGGQDYHPNYAPPAGYPLPNYPLAPLSQPAPASYDYRAQGPPPPPPPPDENHGRKRGPPEDDAQEIAPSSQSPHPASRPRYSQEPRNSVANGYDYPDPTNIAPTSPSTSATSYQSGYPYAGSAAQTTRRLSPQSAHSYDSPRTLPIRDDGKSPPPGQAGSAPGSANGRGGMSVQAMLGDPRAAEIDSSGQRRHKDDTDMLSKLDGKK